MKSTNSNVISNRKAWKCKKKNNRRKIARRNDTATQMEVHSTMATTTIYYPIYRGWSIDITACFFHPEYALIWCTWMMWKDLILHYWYGKENIPTWHCCVGSCDVKSNSLSNVHKENGVWGDFTRQLFNGIDVMETNESVFNNHEILICNNECYNLCMSIFKSHADYQQSAGSIFVKRKNMKLKDLMKGKGKQSKCCWTRIDSKDIYVCGDLRNDRLVDIGKSVRERLKSKKNDRCGGKFIYYIYIYYLC